MRFEDFDDWFAEVKALTGEPRLRPSDMWYEFDTWHDAFLSCLSPQEAVNGRLTLNRPRRRLIEWPIRPAAAPRRVLATHLGAVMAGLLAVGAGCNPFGS